jgi:hypothetical protein
LPSRPTRRWGSSRLNEIIPTTGRRHRHDDRTGQRRGAALCRPG